MPSQYKIIAFAAAPLFCFGCTVFPKEETNPIRLGINPLVIPYEEERSEDVKPLNPSATKQLEGVYECDYHLMGASGASECVDSGYGPASIYACVQGVWGRNDFTVIVIRNEDFHSGVGATVIGRLKLKDNVLENDYFRIVFSGYDAKHKVYCTMDITNKGGKTEAEAEKKKDAHYMSCYPIYTPERFKRVHTLK